ncbi:hypothetical protein FGO68_gene4951 [Halteria grandinella]|uniref:IPO4/5-like TPR repeats domain-containing protein n=1 Tax=Halteria grandinella TaxID=5974 RepID=A0A8J8NHT5_HALGN|nr:hypothetical protein FGO68_gene4951 [Halteria grandinella]
MAGVPEILASISAPDNILRKQAEEAMREQRTNNPQGFFTGLLQVATTTGSADQEMAAMLLKKLYVDKRAEENGLWQLSGGDYTQLKNAVVASLDFTQSVSHLKRKADLVCACSLVALLQSQEDVNKKVYAMYIFELLAEYHLPQDQIIQNSDQFIQLFTGCLQDPNMTVKVAALKAITSFLGSIDDETTVMKYQPAMDWLLDVVIEVLRQDEDKGKASLESLIELSQNHGEIWSQVTQKLLYVVSQIVQNKSFEEGTRQSALEIIGTIAESTPQLLRKHTEELKTNLFPALIHMLAEPLHEDSIEDWAEAVEEELQARNDPASVAADNVNRIASHLGEKVMIKCSTHLIKEAIEQQGSWQLRQAGYLFLGMISDTCKESFIKSMDDVMRMSASGLLDAHPRVRYEALTSLGLLLTELAPNAQKKFHSQLVEVLLRMMANEDLIKLKTQACSCMVNFVRGLIDEDALIDESSDAQKEYSRILAPYSANIVSTITGLFQLSLDKSYAPLQEEVLGLLSCLANVLEGKFAEHYGLFMPGLKQILATMPMETQAQQELRAHCIQTIGFILTAVKDQPEVCKADALEVATVLTTMLNSGRIADTDAQFLAIQNTLSQIGTCIKQEFRQFLPHIMPALFRDVKRDIDLKIQDADLAGKADDGNTAMNVKIAGMEGARQISMNTIALENKINAIGIIKNLASSLGVGFFEYVEQVATLLKDELLLYPYAKAVRKAAAKTMVFLMNACNDSNQMKALFNHVYPTWKASIDKYLKRCDFSELKYIMSEFKKCVNQFENFAQTGEVFMDLQEMNDLIRLLGEVVKDVREDRTERFKQFATAKKKMDEEDIEYFHEDIKKVDKIENFAMEIAGIIISVYKGQVSDAFKQHLLMHFAVTLQGFKGKFDYEILNAVCFFCDVVEYGGEDLFAMTAQNATVKFLECITTFPSDMGLVQSAGYGLGAIAKRAPQGQCPGLGDIVRVLKAIVDQPDSRTDEDKVECTDNIIGALGKCVLFQNLGTAATKEFLNLLPLYSDSTEAQSIHKLLFEQIIAGNPVLTEVKAEVVGCVQRIIRISNEKPELELLDDQGKEKAQVIAGML